MTKATVSTTRSDRIKAFLIIEFVLILIALVLPVTPSKTGRPWEIPPDIATYFKEVLIGLAMGHAIVVGLAVILWMYGRVKGQASSEENRDGTES